MKLNRRFLAAAVVAWVACVLCVAAWALPLPIQNGVLTGNLNANGQAVTNVGALTFADGTTQSTAGGGGGVPAGFTGTVTNLTQTFVTTVGPNLMPPGSQYEGTPCGLTGVILPFYLQPNTSYLVILGSSELGSPIVPGGPVYPGLYLLDGNCYSQGQLSATNVLNFSSVQNPYTVGFGDDPFGGSGPVTFTIQQLTTNVVQSFNVTTYSNGVAQTNTGLGGAYNPPPAPAGVQYGGPMMFDYAYGCTNILSDGVGDLLIQDGGSIFVEASDSQGFGPGNMYLGNGTMTTIASGFINCSGGGAQGYQGPLTDNCSAQGWAGQMAVANGDGTWTWGGGNSFYAPGVGGGLSELNTGGVFSPACSSITDNSITGFDFYSPACWNITVDGTGFSFFGNGCRTITDYGGGYCFYGPGCTHLMNSSDYGAYFATSGSVAASTGVLVVGDNATPVNLANETSLVVANGYQLGLAANNVRLQTDGAHIIPTVPVALTNGVTTVEGDTFYPHTVNGALVWTIFAGLAAPGMVTTNACNEFTGQEPLSWAPVPGALGYLVYSSDFFTYTNVAAVATTNATVGWGRVPFYFWVVATNRAVSSPPSNLGGPTGSWAQP